MRITIGSTVDSTDGHAGRVADLVIDPKRRRLTHLVLAQPHLADGSRLVPVEAIASSESHVTLSWTSRQVLEAPQVERSSVQQPGTLPHREKGWDIGVLLSSPAAQSRGLAAICTNGAFEPCQLDPIPWVLLYDRIPHGTAELRELSQVLSADGHHVGEIRAIAVEPDYAITQIFIDHPHLWLHRETAVPIADVSQIATDKVHLGVNRDALHAHAWHPSSRKAAHGPRSEHHRDTARGEAR